jgi:hypothetical protein
VHPRDLADLAVDRGEQLVVVERRPELEAMCRAEERQDRERGPALALDRVQRPIDVRAQKLAVDADHLPVECVEGAETEVAVAGELGEADVTLVGTVEERCDR